MTNLQQLKEEAREKFDGLFVGGIFTTKERKEITKDFIDSLITKVLEEGKAIGREEVIEKIKYHTNIQKAVAERLVENGDWRDGHSHALLHVLDFLND